MARWHKYGWLRREPAIGGPRPEERCGGWPIPRCPSPRRRSRVARTARPARIRLGGCTIPRGVRLLGHRLPASGGPPRIQQASVERRSVATATEAQQRVTAALETATLMVSDLEEIAREWEGLSDGERASWSLDWSNEMSGLERAVREAGAGTLIPAL